MTMLLLVWAIVMTIIMFGEYGVNALVAGKDKVKTIAADRKEKKALPSADPAEMAHKIRQAEIDAEMHLQDNGFVLTTCENKSCDTCYPGRYEPSTGYENRPKGITTSTNTTSIKRAGAGAKGGGSKRPARGQDDLYYRLKRDTDNLKKDLERMRDDYSIVSGAGETLRTMSYDYIIVNDRNYPRPFEVPSYAEARIEADDWGAKWLVWLWTQKDGKRMYYKQRVG